MNTINLKELAKRECERVEWKKGVSDFKDVVKTIVAFSNDYSNLGGGYVVCGAAEEKDEYGFPKVIFEGLTATTIKEITGKILTHCREKVDPGIVPITEEIPLVADESKRILVFIVPASNHAHSYRPGETDGPAYYIRTGSHTIEARNGLFRELMLKKRQLETWDRRLNDKSTVADLDLLILRDYLTEMKLLADNKDVEDYISAKEKISDFTPPLAGTKGLDQTLRLKILPF